MDKSEANLMNITQKMTGILKLLYSLHNGLDLLHEYTSTRALDEVNQMSVTQSRVIPFV